MQSRATRLYVTNGCLLIVLQLAWAVGSSRLAYLYDVLFMTLGLFSVILGLLQPLVLVALTVKFVFAVVYCVGVWSLSAPYLWFLAAFSERPVPAVDYVFPGLLLAPVVATLLGIVRSGDDFSPIGRRIYIVGGLSLIVVLIASLWYAMVAKWYFDTGGIGQVSNDVFWHPIAFVLAMGALVLGLLPQPKKLALVVSSGYLVGAIMVSFSALVGTYPPRWYASYLLTVGLVLMLPGLLVAAHRVIVGRE